METYKYINICNGESPECSQCNACYDSVDCFDCKDWQCRELWAMHKCNCNDCYEQTQFLQSRNVEDLISELWPS